MPTSSPVAVQDGAAAVAANGVGGAHEVERRLQIHLVVSVDPALRQVEWLRAAEEFRLLVSAFESRIREEFFRHFEFVPFDDAVGETQGSRRIGRDALAQALGSGCSAIAA